MLNSCALPTTLQEDLERYRFETERFRKGLMSAAEYRAFRVPQGVYEQREDGSFMLRVRFPGGVVLPGQMRGLANVSRAFGDGVLHVTTRQDIQVHRVPLDDVHPALVGLARWGMSTKGGGGNTVRNVTACSDAGVCADEAFDVTRYAVAVTEFLVNDPLSYRLPRKYKIGFAGCGKDCPGVMVNDLGFIARRRGEEKGFAVYVGGGMGAHSRVGDLLDEFVPASDAHLVAEAVKRVFDQHGNRRNRHKARLRFLIQRVGMDQFRQWYEGEFTALRRTPPATADIREADRRPAEPCPPVAPAGEGYQAWRETSTVPQKQKGFSLVHIPLPLGDIEADRLERLADIVEAHGEGTVRTTQWQNFALRWVPDSELTELHRKLVQVGLAGPVAPVIRNVIACAGSSTCRLGICRSRALARAVVEQMGRDGLDLGKMGELKIHISGCPNACGRHPLGDIGLFGGARRVGEKLAPVYLLQLGGRTGEGRARLAQGREGIPARNVPAFVVEFLRAFRDSPRFPDYEAFLAAGGRRAAVTIAALHKNVPPFEKDRSYYSDLGDRNPFSLAGRGPGECGAGVFDLIETDLASAKEALEAGKPLEAAVYAARALLVTQGLEARTEVEAIDLFTEHFVGRGLVDGSLGSIVERVRLALPASGTGGDHGLDMRDATVLVGAVHQLYESMDDSLRFPATPRVPAAAGTGGDDSAPGADREADLRGFACPLNYVKVKLLLAEMVAGQVLSVLLSADGFRNVPASAEGDGHEILSSREEQNGWRVLIRNMRE